MSFVKKQILYIAALIINKNDLSYLQKTDYFIDFSFLWNNF